MPNDLQSDLSRLVARIEREDAPLAARRPIPAVFSPCPAGRLDERPERPVPLRRMVSRVLSVRPLRPRGRRQHWGITAAATSALEKCPVCSFRRYMDLHGVIFRLGRSSRTA